MKKQVFLYWSIEFGAVSIRSSGSDSFLSNIPVVSVRKARGKDIGSFAAVSAFPPRHSWVAWNSCLYSGHVAVHWYSNDKCQRDSVYNFSNLVLPSRQNHLQSYLAINHHRHCQCKIKLERQIKSVSRFVQGFRFQNSRTDFHKLERTDRVNAGQCRPLSCWFRLHWGFMLACLCTHLCVRLGLWTPPAAARKLWVGQRQSEATDWGSFEMVPYGLTLFVLVPYFSSSSEVLSLWSSWIPKERENDSEQNVSLWKFLFQDLETVWTAWIWGHGSSH